MHTMMTQWQIDETEELRHQASNSLTGVGLLGVTCSVVVLYAGAVASSCVLVFSVPLWHLLLLLLLLRVAVQPLCLLLLWCGDPRCMGGVRTILEGQPKARGSLLGLMLPIGLLILPRVTVGQSSCLQSDRRRCNAGHLLGPSAKGVSEHTPTASTK